MFKKSLVVSFGVVLLVISFSLGAIAATKYSFTFNGKKQAVEIQTINNKAYVPLDTVVKLFAGKQVYDAKTKTYKVTSNTSTQNVNNEIIVSTKLGDIKKEDFYNKMKMMTGNQIIGEMIVKKVLESKYTVTDKEVIKELENLKGQYGDSYEILLEQAGLTEAVLKENIRQELLERKAITDVKVSDKEIEDYYAMASKELNARHILVADEATARKVIEELKSGGNFADLAKKYSLDSGSAENGGELGWFTVGTMVDEFNDAAYSLTLNTISEPIKSQFGYHIIEVIGNRDNKDYGTLKEKYSEIKTIIALKKGSLATKMNELIKDAKIDIKDKELKNALDLYISSKWGESN